MNLHISRKSFLRTLTACFVIFGITTPAVDLSQTHANVRAVMAVQKEITDDLMKLESLLGTAVGIDEQGKPSLVIFVEREGANAAAALNAIPAELRGVPVRVELTEKFRAMAKPAGGKTSYAANRAKQSLPIKLGTSGGWGLDLANGYCCGGTLGSLVQVNGIKYILSNYHVLEADIVAGGNTLWATTGQAVVQPGLIDVGCNVANSQAVGLLVTIGSLPDSNVDASIAQIVDGMVDPNGEILGIGRLSSQTAAATLNKPVKKAGRTTGLTKSKISGLNATISVAYENECAGTHAFTKTFTGQIVISNRGSSFLAGGDSGSLMVEDVTTNPKAVGLLYAGSSSYAIANPIDEVLTYIGAELGGTATMVGN
jgi:hypothetical protein